MSYYNIFLLTLDSISGETGCGKSTQIPQFLLDDVSVSRSHQPRIVVTQPRRLSAIALAERIADERQEKVRVYIPTMI